MQNKSFAEQLYFGRKLNIFTDLEPDDMLMINMLLKWLISDKRRYEINIICSVTTTPQKKCQFLEEFIKEYYPTLLSSITLYRGYPSDKVFEYTLPSKFYLWQIIMFSMLITSLLSLINIPISLIIGIFLFYFLYTDYRVKTYPIFHHESINFRQSVIVCSAPITDLISAYMNNNNIFQDTIMAIYGSYNIRSFLEKSGETNVVDKLLNSFAKTLYFESFYAIGPCNKVQYIDTNNMLNVPAELLPVINKYPKSIELMNEIIRKIGNNKYLRQSMIEWNQHMLNILTPSPIHDRIIHSIKSSNFCQFVAADWVMMVILLTDMDGYYKQEDLTFSPIQPFRPIINKESETSHIYRFEMTSDDCYRFFVELIESLNESLN